MVSSFVPEEVRLVFMKEFLTLYFKLSFMLGINIELGIIGLEDTQETSIPTLCSRQEPYTILVKWLSSLFLIISSNGALTTAGKLFH